MKSTEKKMFLLLGASTVSAITLWSILPLTEPKNIQEVIPMIVWMFCSFATAVGIFISSIVLFLRGVYRLRHRYRESYRVYKYGLPTKFPKFFRFIAWLNTDD